MCVFGELEILYGGIAPAVERHRCPWVSETTMAAGSVNTDTSQLHHTVGHHHDAWHDAPFPAPRARGWTLTGHRALRCRWCYFRRRRRLRICAGP